MQWSRYKDEQFVGGIANTAAVGLFLALLSELVPKMIIDHSSGYLVIGVVIVLGLGCVVASAGSVQRGGVQTRLNIVGKSIALAFAFLAVGVVLFYPITMTGLKSIFEAIAVIMVLIFVPYSFLLFRRRSEQGPVSTNPSSES